MLCAKVRKGPGEGVNARTAIAIGVKMYFAYGTRAQDNSRIAGILLACCACASALDPSLDISQYAHTAKSRFLGTPIFENGNSARRRSPNPPVVFLKKGMYIVIRQPAAADLTHSCFRTLTVVTRKALPSCECERVIASGAVNRDLPVIPLVQPVASA